MATYNSERILAAIENLAAGEREYREYNDPLHGPCRLVASDKSDNPWSFALIRLSDGRWMRLENSPDALYQLAQDLGILDPEDKLG